MIHGGAESRGCLAVGDLAAEDLFVLAALAGIDKVTVILAPFEFRDEQGGTLPNELPPWTAELYARIKAELAKLAPGCNRVTTRRAHVSSCASGVRRWRERDSRGSHNRKSQCAPMGIGAFGGTAGLP